MQNVIYRFLTGTVTQKRTMEKRMKKYERLKNLREDSDMTQAQLGELLHISQRSYAHFEAGTRGIPIEILTALADIYQVNLDYLIGRTDQKDMLPKPHLKK